MIERAVVFVGLVFAAIGLVVCLLHAAALGTTGRVLRRPRLVDGLLRAGGGVLIVFGGGLAVEGLRET